MNLNRRMTRLLLVGGCALAPLFAGEWITGVVPDVPGGKFTSMRLDHFGNAHVVHVGGDGMLRYSFWDERLKKWFTTDLAQGAAFCSVALDSKERPHISYPAGTGVAHLYWNGQAWQKQFVDVHARIISYFTSIALDGKDNPFISFYEEAGSGNTELRLRVVSWNGSYWELRTIDGEHGSGKFNSLSTSPKGHPEIAYANVEYGNSTVSLRYARWDGFGWMPEVLERTGTSMWSVSMVLDAHDVPHITYTDVTKHQVKYATLHAGKWQLQVVDSIVANAYPDRNGIALDARGTPYMSYYDSGAGLLKVAHLLNGRWVVETVDRGYVGYTSSIEIGSNSILVMYGDENGLALRFARRSVDAQSPGSGTSALPPELP